MCYSKAMNKHELAESIIESAGCIELYCSSNALSVGLSRKELLVLDKQLTEIYKRLHAIVTEYHRGGGK